MVDLDAVASVRLTAQNSCAHLLEVSDFTLTSGQWDQSATPEAGQPVASGTTGCWRSLTAQHLTPVTGSLTLLVAQAGLLLAQWNLSLLEKFEPTLTKRQWIASDIDATHVVNQGDYAHVWFQVIVAQVVTVRAGQTLDSIAVMAGADPASILAINHLDSPVLLPGQRLLVPV